MIIPISHESNEVRRLPWISFLIIALCFLIHISVSKSMDRISSELKSEVKQYFLYFVKHPYLEINSEVKKKLNMNESVIERVKSLYKNRVEIPDADTVADEQEEFDRIGSLMVKSAMSIPFYKWGYIPFYGGIDKLVTYMFIHGGWLHLLGNLLLLYLTGPYLEDIWGRIVYPLFYISAGVFSALMYSLRFPDLKIPLIGASGAIAGLMGAFLIRFWRTRIKFFYFFFVIAGTFRAPAWIMLPLWFGFEAFDASQLSSMSHGGGVAHHVHIWGFVFGVVIALIIKLTGIEEKFLSKKIKEKISFIDKGFEAFSKAKSLYDEGKKEEAFSALVDIFREYPVTSESVELIWMVGTDLGRRDETVVYLKRLIESELMKGDSDLAYSHYGLMTANYPDSRLNISHEIAILKMTVDRDDRRAAEDLALKIAPAIDSKTPVGIVNQFIDISIAASLAGLKPIREMLLRTVEHPEITGERKKAVKELLSEFKVSDGEKGRSSDIDFKFYQAILDGLSREKIRFVFKNSELRTIPISAIKGISVARIEGNEGRSEMLIDLFIDNFEKKVEKIRGIRLYGNSFDPLKFASGARDREHALRVILSFILRSAKALPIPDIETVELKKFQDFSDETRYENYLRLLLKR